MQGAGLAEAEPFGNPTVNQHNVVAAGTAWTVATEPERSATVVTVSRISVY